MNTLRSIAAEISVALWSADDSKLASLCRKYADTHDECKRPTLLQLDIVDVGWDGCGSEVEP